MPAPDLQVDVLIFGGGIAGLWTLARLMRDGYSCLLLESVALGSGQTIASQGIIHGGIKYALTGEASRASRAIAEMPAIWQACLSGRGEIDLSSATVLSDHQHLWTTSGIGSRLVGVAASKAIRTEVARIAPEQRPDSFAQAPRGVDLYRVDEPILDPASVLRAFAHQHAAHLALIAPIAPATPGLTAAATGSSTALTLTLSLARTQPASPPAPIRIIPRAIILAAGESNARLFDTITASRAPCPSPRPAQQLRPLHMLMARAPLGRPDLPAIYGHCVALSDKPRITITTQCDSRGRAVWYIGGQIAERGIDLSPRELIADAQREIASCLPWVPLDGLQWSTLRVNRAEGFALDGKRPDEPVVLASGNVISLWPTKLAFAPLAAAQALDRLREQRIEPSGRSVNIPGNLLAPPVAPLPWEREDLSWT